MRIFATLLISWAMYWLVAFDNPALDRSIRASIDRQIDRTFYEKELIFSGLRALDRSRIDPLIPLDKSVMWWFLNKSIIESRLEKEPAIASAKVSACDGSLVASWGCFRVEVRERQPAFLAKVSDKPWLIATDGTFLAPLDSPEIKRAVNNHPGWSALELRIIDGLVIAGASPEAVRARFEYARQAIEIIEKAGDLPVESIRLDGGSEIKVRFRDLKLTAIFDFKMDETESLREKAIKFKRLLEEFGDRKYMLDKVDLAFNNVAVVNLIDTRAEDSKSRPKANNKS